MRGWSALADAVAPSDGSFLTRTKGGWFAGDLSSFIDRQVYLHGEYEGREIELFITTLPAHRRGTILDIGANVGTHSIAFARQFREVHAFEPNPALWEQFKRNIALNSFANVRLHPIGLADEDATATLYSVDDYNWGLGTLSSDEKYDRKLRACAQVEVRAAGPYVERCVGSPIDAIKLDIQGLEPEVLKSLRRVLLRDLPIVWVEIGGGTQRQIANVRQLQGLLPFPCAAFRFEHHARVIRDVTLVPASGKSFQRGDYVLVPQLAVA